VHLAGAEGNGLTDHVLLCEHRTFQCPRCDANPTPADANKHCETECLVRGPIKPNHKRKREEKEEERKEASNVDSRAVDRKHLRASNFGS
jgi:hypothetical protein